jgi:hypothetical protein
LIKKKEKKSYFLVNPLHRLFPKPVMHEFFV